MEHCLNGELTGVSKERKEAFESLFYEPRPSPLLLEAESFLAWLKEESPYEGEKQQEEPKENQFYMSDELQLTVACSRELYPTTPPEASTPGEKKTNAQAENKRLREWLQRKGFKEGSRPYNRIRVMVNPYAD